MHSRGMDVYLIAMFFHNGIGFTFRRFSCLPCAGGITVLFTSGSAVPLSLLMWNFTITDAGFLRFCGMSTLVAFSTDGICSWH